MEESNSFDDNKPWKNKEIFRFLKRKLGCDMAKTIYYLSYKCEECGCCDGFKLHPCVECKRYLCNNELGGTCIICSCWCLCYQCGKNEDIKRGLQGKLGYDYGHWIDNICSRCNILDLFE